MTDSNPTMQDIKKQYFPMAELDKASDAIELASKLATEGNGKVVFNFDPAKDFPANYGISVAPIKQRDEAAKKTVVIGVCIAAIPEITAIQEEKNGAEWIHNTLIDSLIAKVQNAVRPRKDGETAATTPFEIEEFITSNRAEGVLVAFNKLAPDYIKVLKDKGCKLLTVAIFRNIMASAAYAAQQYPALKQEIWKAILTTMIKRAKDSGLQPGLMVEWLKDRDTAGLPEVTAADLSDLDFGTIGMEVDDTDEEAGGTAPASASE